MEQNNNTIPTAPEIPVAPEMQPGVPVEPQSNIPVAQAGIPVATDVPVAPIAQPGVPLGADMFEPETTAFQLEGLRATDALTMPEAPKAPDPIEEELKAPLRAAGPVPGSIGSAISVPSDGTNPNAVPMAGVRSVTFNDALTRNAPKGKKATEKAKNKNTTLILLGVLLAVIVIAIIVMVFVF